MSSGWLMVEQDPRGWQDASAQKANHALAQDTVWAVGALAFLAVFARAPRPCCFINALATTEGGWSAAPVRRPRGRDRRARGAVLDFIT